MYFYARDSMPHKKELVPGTTANLAWGEKIMLSLVEINPGSVVPMHSHPHEQAGIVVEGEFEFIIGGEKRRVKRGDMYIIPGGVQHSAIGLDKKALVLDIFSPPRDDYKTS
jgi:quercetin dioxygenase-like cupin family protein